jgi:PAB1-binding protein PBP1
MAKKPTKSKSVSVSIIGSSKSQERKWEVDSALSTLKRAEEIRKNLRLMADVKKAATEMQNIVNND